MEVEHEPFVGPRPFEVGEQDRFFGRDREVSDILSLVVAHSLVLVYSESGAGKSSLVNAGLIPALEDEGFQILPLARVRGTIPPDFDLGAISNVYVASVLAAWAEGRTDLQRLATTSLTGCLEQARVPVTDGDHPPPRVAIFDQFEELFIAYPDRWPDRRGFFAQLGEALEGDPFLRVVLVIREDFIAQLDPFKDVLPEKLRTRYRLERLRRGAALAAVVKPVAKTHRSFAAGAAEALVDDLLRVRVATEGGQVQEVPGPFVEPVQLQVVCHSLWQDLPPAVTEITRDHLRTFADPTQALSSFYERAILEASQKTGSQEGQLRRWFEKVLITPAGTRGTVYRGQEETGGLPNAAVDELERVHLIRGERRAGGRWYELNHDRFIEPILESNRRWLADHRQAETIRRRLESRGEAWRRSGGLEGLLDRAELLEAERWLASPEAAELGTSEAVLSLVQASRAALEAEEQARERELVQAKALAEEQRRRAEAEARAVRRLRRLAAGLLVVSLAAASAAVYALVQRSRAKAHEVAAEEARTKAEASERRARTYEEEAARVLQTARSMEAQLASAEAALADIRAQADENAAAAKLAREAAENLKREAEQERGLARELRAEAEEQRIRAERAEARIATLEQDLEQAQATTIPESRTGVPAVPAAEPTPVEIRRPSDSLFGAQWGLFNHGIGEGESPGGISLPREWRTNRGNRSIVVAILSTGIVLDHPDLLGSPNLVPGFDMISIPSIAADGDGRDPDPSDPGDEVSAGRCFPGSPPRPSSWMGTHEAGIVGAAWTNNGLGIAGVNWHVAVQPVRVLGRCGGTTADIVDGIRWAAGVSVPGVPANPTPASIILFGGGGSGRCPALMQAVINQAVAAGATIVVPAGNEAADASAFFPVGCANTIGVAASDMQGRLVTRYSNWGAAVDIMAPGGDVIRDDNGDGEPDAILSLVKDGYAAYNGTSSAAAHVAGVAALLLAREPSLTPAQVLERLQANALPRSPEQCPRPCGAGLLNADFSE